MSRRCGLSTAETRARHVGGRGERGARVVDRGVEVLEAERDARRARPARRRASRVRAAASHISPGHDLGSGRTGRPRLVEPGAVQVEPGDAEPLRRPGSDSRGRARAARRRPRCRRAARGRSPVIDENVAPVRAPRARRCPWRSSPRSRPGSRARGSARTRSAKGRSMKTISAQTASVNGLHGLHQAPTRPATRRRCRRSRPTRCRPAPPRSAATRVATSDDGLTCPRARRRRTRRTPRHTRRESARRRRGPCRAGARRRVQ